MLHEVITSVVVATVPVLLSWGLVLADKHLGVKLGQAAKDTVTEAIVSGILSAIAKHGPAADRVKLTDEAMAYVAKSSPDSLRVLRAPEAVIRAKITGKLAAMLD